MPCPTLKKHPQPLAYQKNRKLGHVRSRNGFALISTLSLMVLIVMLLVAILSLTTVSLKDSGQNEPVMEARANARMALKLAIGELQQQMGPDQRISMTANQRTDPNSDGSVTSSALGNIHWTGVYDSWLSTSTNRPSPNFRSWLISGASSLVSQENAAGSPLSGNDVIELVGSGTVGSSDNGQVVVPAIELFSGTNKNGRIAWWVGDQGVKAALATPPASTNTSLGVTRNNLQSAPRNAIELASTGTVKPFENIAANDPRLLNVINWSQSELLASDPVAPRPLFHDLSGYSSGLLTNVRAGGFRKDLSMKMETYSSKPDLTDPANVLYYVQNEQGINFLELWSYYNLYKQLKYGGGGKYTTSEDAVPASAPYLRTADSIQGLEDDNWHIYKQPITINYQTVLSFESASAPKDPGRQALYLNMDPVVTLWNPLDVPVDVPPHRSVINTNLMKCWLYVFWVIPYDINVQINGGPIRKCSIMRSIQGLDADKEQQIRNSGKTPSIDYNMMRLNAGQVERITLKPGEVLKISQTKDQPFAGSGGYNGLDGKKGFNYGGGTHFALLDEYGQYVLIDPSDQITYFVSPNNLTCDKDSSGGNIIEGIGGGNSRRWATTQINVVMGSPWWPVAGRAQVGQVSVDDCYGYRRLKLGEAITNSSNKTAQNSTRVYANDAKYSEVYPVIEGLQDTRVLTAGSLTTSKATFMVHSYGIKTEVENQRGTRMFSRFNPKVQHVDFYNLLEEERDLLPYETKVTPLTSWLNAPLDVSTDGQGFFGTSFGSELGSKFVNTHSVPRQPIVSLAAFQDSFANGFNRLNTLAGGSFKDAPRPLLPQISHAIGNSLAPSVIAPDKTEGNLANNPNPLADHSYLANRALWDDYFLSGITPQPTPAFTQNRDQKTVALEFFNNSNDLPVVRYQPELGNRTPSELVNSFFSGIIPNQDAINKVASHLRVDGLFNVNSVSVEAWKTVLGSLKNRPIVVRNELGVESIVPSNGKTSIATVGAPRDIIVQDDPATNAVHWYGRRALTDDEIDGLARGIVREVRKRGPFLSLADFVNRRVGNNNDLARAGAIQNALDSEDVTINKNQNTNRAVDESVASRFEFPDAEEGAMNYGSPSLVKQGDILTPIAPVLSARSDSFIIRTYGETLDGSGNVTARAWCEAVVERNREYVDPSDTAETLPANLSSISNKNFGRQFRIISFRWLDPQEI